MRSTPSFSSAATSRLAPFMLSSSLESDASQEIDEAGIRPQRIERRLDPQPGHPGRSISVGLLQQGDRAVLLAKPEMDLRHLIHGIVSPWMHALERREHPPGVVLPASEPVRLTEQTVLDHGWIRALFQFRHGFQETTLFRVCL